MKIFSQAAVAVVLLIAGQAMAQPNQPAVIPAEGDYGVYATQDQLLGLDDPIYARAYDNFTLTDDIEINGFCWTGVYAEAFPTVVSDTDFIVQIWNIDPANNNYADIHNGPVATFNFEGGATAGVGGADMAVTALGYVNPSTDTTPGGGSAYHYDADIDTPYALAAGDYWISITADQLFSNEDPDVYDPEWQWHLGAGPGDGFTAFDRALDPPGTLQAGILQAGKDLAFEIKAVPEPNSIMMAMFGVAAVGLLRRKRQ